MAFGLRGFTNIGSVFLWPLKTTVTSHLNLVLIYSILTQIQLCQVRSSHPAQPRPRRHHPAFPLYSLPMSPVFSKLIRNWRISCGLANLPRNPYKRHFDNSLSRCHFTLPANHRGDAIKLTCCSLRGRPPEQHLRRGSG